MTMRFKIGVEVCVEVDSLETLDMVEGRASDAVTQAVSEWFIKHPTERWVVSGTGTEGLDAESQAALDEEAAGWEDGISPIEMVRRRGPRPIESDDTGMKPVHMSIDGDVLADAHLRPIIRDLVEILVEEIGLSTARNVLQDPIATAVDEALKLGIRLGAGEVAGVAGEHWLQIFINGKDD